MSQWKDEAMRQQSEWYAESTRRRSERMKQLIRQRLPSVVIAERLGVATHLVTRVASDMGIRLPTFAEWDEVNAA